MSLLLELVKHAETKATAVLASAGVLGGLLYALLGRLDGSDPVVVVAAMLSVGAAVVSGLSAGAALKPRAPIPRPLPGLFFYRSITRRFPDHPDSYTRELRRVLADREALLAALSHEVWHNAQIATKKYRAINLGVTTLLIALASLAATATLTVFAS